METSVKYAVAHMYSSRRPQEWEKRIVDEGWLESYKVWLNLRNDDIFMHRWGSPDYARDFIKWMPHEHMAGFYMGSDTYVWGREFISKNPETAGRLEIDKHWYRFRLWGQLAYNNELGDDYWQAALKHRFPGVDARAAAQSLGIGLRSHSATEPVRLVSNGRILCRRRMPKDLGLSDPGWLPI